MAAWMATGFTHGVMNTDNMSLLGVTADLNVFGFLNRYDKDFVSNHIDDQSRYRFGKQAKIYKWNLHRLADAMAGRRFLNDDTDRYSLDEEWTNRFFDGVKKPHRRQWREEARGEIDRFDERMRECYSLRMNIRMGLPPPPDKMGGAGSDGDADGDDDGDNDPSTALVSAWTSWLQSAKADYNRATRALALALPAMFPKEKTRNIFPDEEELEAAAELVERVSGAGSGARTTLMSFLRDYAKVIVKYSRREVSAPTLNNSGSFISRVQDQIRSTVPLYVMRTHAARLVSQRAVEGEPQYLQAALRVLQNPFGENSSSETAEVDLSLKQRYDDARHGKKYDIDLEAETWVKVQFGLIPPEHQQSLKTSCGGQ